MEGRQDGWRGEDGVQDRAVHEGRHLESRAVRRRAHRNIHQRGSPQVVLARLRAYLRRHS
jgi:hypothetical protein